MWSVASQFLPHSVCLALAPAVLWLHAASDAIIALSYYSIPLVLVVFARKRAEGRFRGILILFALFVLACGTTHILDIVTLWSPIYVVQGTVKAFTAFVSLLTALVLWPLLPHALKMPSHAELEREIDERREAEARLRELNANLEARVLERTVELETAKRMAERASLAKSRFLAAASHDLRQPFQAMELYREVLDTRLSDPWQRQVLASLGSAMASGRDLLNALLHISTLEAGVTVPTFEAVTLAELLQPLAEEFAGLGQRQGLDFRQVPCTAAVWTDRTLLTRMVRNLLTNALRYTAHGRVLMGCRRSAGAIRLEVWDTGPGIPPERQAEIWEEFTQLGNIERDRTKGLGLGLAIVARTAELLKHPVGLRSQLGKGSVFFVEMPIAGSQCSRQAG